MPTEPRAARTITDDRGEASRRSEATMSDFAAGIRRSMQAARASVKQQRDAQGRQEDEEAGRQQQNRQR